LELTFYVIREFTTLLRTENQLEILRRVFENHGIYSELNKFKWRIYII